MVLMNRCANRKNLRIVISILLMVGVVLGFERMVSSTSALTYQQDIGVNFTLNSILRMDLSSDYLLINNLVPGSSSDSNIITVDVVTNSVNGYTLNATVGNNATYNTRNLIHEDSNQTANFSSVAFGSSIANRNSLSDNTWAYSYSVDNGSWANYSGLPLYNDTTNIATLVSPNGPISHTLNFKIAAKASSTQPSGEYDNVINFTLVVTPVPTTVAMAYADAGKTQLNGYYKMQDMNSSICDAIEVVDDPLQVIDARDYKVYWIAKLQDGHCWMTQNLDLDLDSSVTYTHADTDLGWGSDTATTSWTPTYSTIHLNADGQTFDTIGATTAIGNTPKSLDVGNWYYAGYNGTTLLGSTTVNYLTSTNRVTTNGIITVNNGSGVDYFSNYPFATNGTHGHVGNYYNWAAAVASNDTSGYNTATNNNVANNPQNSICPAGWRLPTIKSASPLYSDVENEFAILNYIYNNETWVTNSSAKLELAPLYFVRAGYINGGSLSYPGYYGYYWSSTVGSSNAYSYVMLLHNSSVNTNTTYNRYRGHSIRCVAR